MWAYVTELTLEQVLWCKVMQHTTNVFSNRACIKIKSGAIWAGINSAASTSAGTYQEKTTNVSPIRGWNFIVVRFDVSSGVSRAITYLRKPDGVQVVGSYVTFTSSFLDSSSF